MKLVPRQEIDRRWAAHNARRMDRARRKHENRVKSLDLVLRLDDGRKLEFRGRHYGVPPVPWPLAVRIVALQECFQDFTDQAKKHRDNPQSPAPTVADWEAVYRETARLFKKVCRPEGWLRRLLWPLIPSPLNGAPPSEVGMALGFFSACLRLDAIETLIRQGSPPSTSPSSSDASVSASPLGATNGASRAPGRRS